MKTTIPEFADKQELFTFLKDNKATLIAERKEEVKWSDGAAFSCMLYDPLVKSFKTIKANNPVNVGDLNELKVKVVINTTNIMDSHGDVHMPGLWKKSLKENKNIKFLQEHGQSFKDVIADKDDLKAYTQVLSWKELGYPKFQGSSEALVFEATIKKNRNPVMFEQYASGYVDNHSVGMQYVTMVLCINDEDPYYGAEFEAWNKYIDQVVNRDVAEKNGYFWAVKEAKAREGSAVVFGSNYATPTLENNLKGSRETTPKVEPTHSERAVSTLKKFSYLTENFSIH